jgi:DNA-binding Xre family transcriptional regulator
MKIILHQLMKERGVTYAQVNQATGISTSTLTNLANGKRDNGGKKNPANIGLENVLGRLCDFFECTPNDLLKPGDNGRYGA